MKKILGINVCSHDTSAAIIINGKLICACEEERFNKEKHTKSFPTNAINECLKISRLKIKDIDCVAVSTDPLRQIRNFWISDALQQDHRLKMMIEESETIKEFFNIEKTIREKLNYSNQIKYYKHHSNHLSSCFFPSGFKKSLVVSYDGVGEGETGYFALADNHNKIKIIHDKNKFPHSLGLIYAAITDFLGWRYNCDEGIIMGLASYGDPYNTIPKTNIKYINVFRKIIQKDNKLKINIDTNWITYHKERDTWVSKKFLKMFGKRRRKKDKIKQHHKNIAAALQKRLEEIVLEQLKYLKKKYKSNYLCLSGGVALNCSMNGRIVKSKIFKEVFVQPASGDAGLAIGAAINCSLEIQKGKSLKFPTNAYLGSRYSNKKILNFINKFKSKIRTVKTKKNVFDYTSDALIKKKIVGWFQGEAEFGPRALGNRSILAIPRPKNIKDHINRNVKFREEFRPFAPAVIDEMAGRYFNINQKSEHMLIAFDAIKEKQDLLSATIHVDNTCRVQTVNSYSNKKFFLLLNSIYKKTGVPILLNTSFNIKGQPIVNSPEDAINCFLKYNIDLLVLGDHILEKK